MDTDYKNPFLIIGLSGITRKEVYSVRTKRLHDVHLFQNWDKNLEELDRVKTKFISSKFDSNQFKDYLQTWEKYFFDLDSEIEKLEWQMLFLDGLLKSKNINYVVFNSLQDNIDKIKDKIQFLSLKSKDIVELVDIDTIEDCWYHKLRVEHFKNECENFNDKSYRSHIEPFGRYFCHGHPSPGANRDLYELILNYINENYS